MNIRLGREADLAQWLPLWQGDQTFGKTAIADKSGFVQYCSRRLNIDPPCRFNIDPGRVVAV
jgi:hypothetical protein